MAQHQPGQVNCAGEAQHRYFNPTPRSHYGVGLAYRCLAYARLHTLLTPPVWCTVSETPRYSYAPCRGIFGCLWVFFLQFLLPCILHSFPPATTGELETNSQRERERERESQKQRKESQVKQTRKSIATMAVSTAEEQAASHFQALHAKKSKKQSSADKQERATVEQVIDPKTRILLFKLINNQFLHEIHGCMSTGIFHLFFIHFLQLTLFINEMRSFFSK